jgi:hypothetical protein
MAPMYASHALTTVTCVQLRAVLLHSNRLTNGLIADSMSHWIAPQLHPLVHVFCNDLTTIVTPEDRRVT